MGETIRSFHLSLNILDFGKLIAIPDLPLYEVLQKHLDPINLGIEHGSAYCLDSVYLFSHAVKKVSTVYLNIMITIVILISGTILQPVEERIV